MTDGEGLSRYVVPLSAALTLVFLLPPCAPAQRSPGVQIPDATTPIVEALRNRHFDDALQQTTTALAKSPNDSRLWTLRGMALAGAEQARPALAAYKHALRLAPSYLPALAGAAQLEYSMGSDGAKSLLLRVLAQRPNDSTTHAMLAVVDYKANRCGEAIPHFQQAEVLVRRQPLLLDEYASCLAALGRYEQSIPPLQDALSFSPGQPNATYNLALAQLNAGHAQDALRTLEPLIGTSADEDVLTLAADLYEANDNTPRAVEVLRQAIQASPKSAGPYLQFSTLSYNHKSIPAAIEMLNAGLTQLPNEPRLYLARAVLESEKGDFTAAMEDFAKVNHLDPNLSIASVAEGLADSEQHKVAKALSSFRAAANAHPNDAFTQYLLAEALSENQDASSRPEQREAVTAAWRAVALDPKMSSALNLLGTLALREGQPQLAIDYSQKALAIDPNDQQALYHLMLALRKAGRDDEVPPVLNRLISARKLQAQVQKRNYKIEVVSGFGHASTFP